MIVGFDYFFEQCCVEQVVVGVYQVVVVAVYVSHILYTGGICGYDPTGGLLVKIFYHFQEYTYEIELYVGRVF